MEAREINALSPLVLAYVGDAVYELRVRERLLGAGQPHMACLHKLAVSYVKAERQDALVTELLPLLTPEEADVLRRGRNAKSGHQPPNVAVSAYRRATGLEALVGWLHLTGRTERLDMIFDRLFQKSGKDETQK